MSADKVKEEVDEEMPDAAEVKQEELDSMVRERTVGQGRPSAFPFLHSAQPKIALYLPALPCMLQTLGRALLKHCPKAKNLRFFRTQRLAHHNACLCQTARLHESCGFQHLHACYKPVVLSAKMFVG